MDKEEEKEREREKNEEDFANVRAKKLKPFSISFLTLSLCLIHYLLLSLKISKLSHSFTEGEGEKCYDKIGKKAKENRVYEELYITVMKAKVIVNYIFTRG